MKKSTEKEIEEVGKEVEKEVENNFPKFFLIFILSLLIVAVTFIFQRQLSHFQTLGIIGIFFFNFFSSATVLVPSLGLATVVAGGNLFNPLIVGLVAGIGGAIGELTSYILGRSGKEIILKKEFGHFSKLKSQFLKYGAILIFVFAFIPNPIFDGVGIIAGGLYYPLKKFFLIVLTARILRNLLLAYLGASIG